MISKIRLYFPDKIKSDLVAYLNKNQSHYIKNVMRLKPGENISIFNSYGEWNSKIERYEKGKAQIARNREHVKGSKTCHRLRGREWC